MLKFGKIVNLEELERDADMSQEDQLAQVIEDTEMEFEVWQQHAAKETERLDEEYITVS